MLYLVKKKVFVTACAMVLALGFGASAPVWAAKKPLEKSAAKSPAKTSAKPAAKSVAKAQASKPAALSKAGKTGKAAVAPLVAQRKSSAQPVRTAARNQPRARVQLASKSSSKKAATERVQVAYVTVRRGGKLVRVARASERASLVRVAHVPAEPPRQSFGQMAGLHNMQDELELKSSVALVMDQDTREVLFSKNDHAVLPIASITKLMTGLVISEAQLNMQEMLQISQEDVDTEKGSRSRLAVGTDLSRSELLHLALMSSENRAAHALGRTYPGGLQAFVAQMNARAKQLGMVETRFVEPTGLSSRNQSSAHDLARLVGAAYNHTVLREYSTSTGYDVPVGERMLRYNNTNGLVSNPEWEIGLQKTGFISEAGRCLVMQARVAGRKLIMVFLDSAGKFSRLGDAERVRRWVEVNQGSIPQTAVPQRVSTGATMQAAPKS